MILHNIITTTQIKEQMTFLQKKYMIKTMITEGDKTGYNDSDNQWK